MVKKSTICEHYIDSVCVDTAVLYAKRTAPMKKMENPLAIHTNVQTREENAQPTPF